MAARSFRDTLDIAILAIVLVLLMIATIATQTKAFDRHEPAYKLDGLTRVR